MMLIQFILVGIIFFQNKKYKYLIEQINFKIGSMENQQKQLNEKISVVQSYIMRLTSQVYRLQPENK